MLNYKELSNVDLIKMLINEKNDSEVALELIDKFGTLPEIIIHSTEQELTSIKGVGPRKAAQLKAFHEVIRRIYEVPCSEGFKITSPKDVYQLLAPSMLHQQVEHFKILLLNTKNIVTSIEHISTGTLNASIVHPRDVFRVAIRKNANSIILCHNHPGSIFPEIEPVPSSEDIAITNRLIDVGNLMSIKVLDHIIIGSPGRYISFKEKNLI